MVQSGIAYAAGQLLAVVAPRTVLVVDAPTDWSLAGPLWELALDDAPVDEILDVLIRRGIRTAPSFAIVRVETDAVRALVRGSVPVCFERVGEPVRLDATGATTWLEGLISGARRVLVGDVESNSTLPFLVSTGVVLVSGLALPCAPVEGERRQIGGSTGSEPSSPSDGDGAPAEESSYFTPPVPVSSGGGPFAPVAGREPRVVDLTRSEPRSPVRSSSPTQEPRESRSFASSWGGPDRSGGSPRPELNGHAPSVLDSPSDPSSEPEASLFASPSYESTPSSFDQAPSAFESPAAHSRPDEQVSDDPGELLDLDESVEEERSHSETRVFPEFDADIETGNKVDGYSASEPVNDDLLIEPADGEGPPSPSPADLPNPDQPSVPAPLNGLNESSPAEPAERNFGGVPAAWPPAAVDEAVDEYPSAWTDRSDGADKRDEREPAPMSAFARPEPDRAAEAEKDDFDPAPEVDSKPEQPRLADLPLRVRGRSLRPEQAPAGNDRDFAAPPAASPVPPLRVLGEGRFRNVAESEDRPAPVEVGNQVDGYEDRPASDSEPVSGSLVLPTFFRGSRTARKPGSADSPEPSSAPVNPPSNPSGNAPASAPSDEAAPGSGPVPWALNGAKTPPPVAWAPPVRRGYPDQTDFNGGPPSMPGVLRPLTPSGHPSGRNSENDEDTGPETEYLPPATEIVEGEIEPDDEPREPARLLGVWCDAGHVTSPDRSECRVCGLEVPPQAPILVARPPLGVLIFDNGDRVEVDRPVVLGRDPKPVSSPDPDSPILHAVSSSTGQVSRTHAEIRADGWDVVLTDLDAMNGTALTRPGESPVAIEAGVPTVITPGARVDLGGESGFVFEVEG
jgi:FHA domain-containing protein